MKNRLPVGLLTLSATAFVALLASEGYSPIAYVPTQGDKLTIGFGSTIHEDGTPVTSSDRTDPVRAVIAAQAHIGKDEQAFRETLPGVSLSQAEYDLYLDFTYQYGIGNWRGSSMRRHLLAGDYVKACHALLMWRKQGGRDCSLPQNWGPKGCKGVWTRQQERHAKCMAAQVSE